jgi:spore coat protein CotF
MYTTYHLSSAQEVTTDILEAIKANFKSKPIVITVEEEIDTTTYLMSSPANKNMLKKSIEQDKNAEHVLVKL